MSAGLSPLRAGRKVLAILAVAFLLAVGASLLPENPYQRWQLLAGTVQQHLGWVYERTAFDPAPVDVAFIGSSRIAEGVDAPRIAAALKARGLPSHVVNLAIPMEGRNLHYLVARQLLAHKTPKLLVVGVEEAPYHQGHPGFKYIADPELVPTPLIAKPNYFADLIYLPFRQMRLFAAMIAPDGFGLAKTFDPARYAGASLETAGVKTMDDGSEMPRPHPAAPADQARCLTTFLAGAHGQVLPARLSNVEFAAEYHYVRLIAEEARRKGAEVVFLAAPYYTSRGQVVMQPFYESLGPVWNAGFLAPHPEFYADCAHLDGPGARRLTDWLAPRVVAALAGRGAT